MQQQIQSLLNKIQSLQFNNLSHNQITNYQLLTWKYGNIIFTKIQPNLQFINNINHQSKLHNLFITTYPFNTYFTIPSLYLQSIQSRKSLSSVQKITQFLIQNNTTRNSHLIIKGGGLLMDLAGFSASIFMRGIKYVTLIPTTLLGMVDATVGGKTAVNYSNTKNLLGAIRNPNNIIVYPGYLSTQTQRQFFNGMVETIKMAITYDKQFFQLLQNVNFKTLRSPQNANLLQKIIKKSLMIKIMVVEKDLTEQNQRKWLNFGHTIAHGIQLDDKNQLLHGQCVAIGMVKALQISLDKGIIAENNSQILQRLKKLLKKLNLSTQIPFEVNVDDMIHRMLKDKKMSDFKKQVIDFVLIEDIGKRCIKPTQISVQQLKSYFGNAVEVSYPHSGVLSPINDIFPFPSSKSISLRYLYISCLAVLNSCKSSVNQQFQSHQQITLTNFLSSEDTQKMVYSLRQLGFIFDINLIKRQIKIIGYKQKSSGELDVGNSGITARFILPLCFMIRGRWKINCHKRMQQRPNKQIFKLCSEHFDGQINYLNKNLSFPVQIISTGKSKQSKPLVVQGKQSSQFISSAMINWSFIDTQKQIIFKSQQQLGENIVSQSYLHMTNKCLQTFNIKSMLNKKQKIINMNSRNIKIPQSIRIENDLSTYSYPYIFYQLHGYINNQIQSNKYMQGDVLFYEYVQDLKKRIKQGYKQLTYDFNNCTDTFMTFIIYCCSDNILCNNKLQKIIISNISNQRVKQSNRINLTIKNLKKIGIRVQQYENKIQIIIKPLQLNYFQSKQIIIFQTHQDHRLAMSFAILSTLLSKKFPSIKFIIDSKKAVQKTFPQFWKYLQQSGINLNFISVKNLQTKQLNLTPIKTQNYYKKYNLNQNIVKNSLFIIGNRGSGKTTIGKNVASRMNLGFLDLDDIITQEIKESFKLPNIQKMIQRYGWNEFRNLQSKTLQQTMTSLRYSTSIPFIISTGGGILQRQLNRAAFNRQRANIFYLQRPFSQLKAFKSTNRPDIDDFQRISKQREGVYESICSQIITLPEWLSYKKQQQFTIDCINKYLGKQRQLDQGYILCIGDEIQRFEQVLTKQQIQQVNTVQIRIDKLISKGLSIKQIRQLISRWRIKYPNKKYILTLRTTKQFGQFRNDNNSYLQKIKQISKLPCDFIDIEISKQPKFIYNHNKFIYSYHGNNQYIINKLIHQQQGFKKYCYLKSTHQIQQINLYQKYYHQFNQGICIDLSNPLTRLKNKYQMIIPQKSFIPQSTGIMTLNHMKYLKQLFKSI